MRGNYKYYALMPEDCPFDECCCWFWAVLGEDNVYPKSFIEKLRTMVAAIDAGDIDVVDFSFDDWD